MTEAIRIGIIGAGGIVRDRHLPGFSRIEGVEVTAVCNRTPESTERIADEYGIRYRLGDWRELIAHPEVNAVLVGTWPYLHRDASLAALAAGKPVFCQARMARNASEARQMRDAQRASGLPAMLCPPPHGMKWDRAIKRLLAEGCIGTPLSIRIQSLHGRYLDPHAPLSWRQDKALSGYNTLTLGIYAEVIRRWFGDHVSLQAVSRTHVKQRVEPTSGLLEEVQIPDTVWMTAELACGAIAEYSLSGTAHAAPSDRIEMYGAEGTLVYEIEADRVLGAKYPGDPLKELPLSDDESNGWEVELDFIRAVRGERAPEPSFEDGVAYMDVVEATARSTLTGRRIVLPLGD